jgi:hypothetical protein
VRPQAARVGQAGQRDLERKLADLCVIEIGERSEALIAEASPPLRQFVLG